MCDNEHAGKAEEIKINFPRKGRKIFMQYVPEYRHVFYDNANVLLCDCVTSLNDVFHGCPLCPSEDKQVSREFPSGKCAINYGVRRGFIKGKVRRLSKHFGWNIWKWKVLQICSDWEDGKKCEGKKM